MRNRNRPAPRSIISVEPIRCGKDITALKERLKNPRDLALFVVGINTAFRAGDLPRLTVGQVRHLEAGDILSVRERKTGERAQGDPE